MGIEETEHQHTISLDDHFTRLARSHGYGSWQTLWEHNGDLSGRRDNPNLLFTGFGEHAGDSDEVTVPPVEGHEGEAGTETTFEREVSEERLFIRLRILNEDFSRMANVRFRLEVPGAEPVEDRTNDQGEIEQEIPPTANRARLQIWPPESSEGSASTETETTTDTTEEDDADTDDDAVESESAEEPAAPTPPQPITFELRIGALNPIQDDNIPDDGISGLQQRLNNLGILCGAIDGDAADNTEAAIKLFQRTFGLEVNGQPNDETKQRLATIHDQPDGEIQPEAEMVSETGTMTAETEPNPLELFALRPPDDSATRTGVGIDMAHVAPDHQERSLINTLRYPPIYRISLRLADEMDLIFPDTVSTDTGRMARLQALEYFHYPINHTDASDCLDHCWHYFKQKAASSPMTDTQAEERLKELLRGRILEDGELPPPDESKRILLPGGYSYITRSGQNRLGDNRYEVEDRYYTANPSLGRIPLVAKVEQLSQSGRWMLAQRVRVYFQLVHPAPIEDLNREHRAENLRQTNATGATSNPRDYVSRIRLLNTFSSDDPQVMNAFHSKGGKRQANPNPRADQYFVVGQDVAGFHADPDGDRELGHAPYQQAEESSGTIPYSVKVLTNEQGEAGVIFTPSRCGGDRFRIRVFVGPGTLASDGKEIEDNENVSYVRETGTLLIWRVARLSHVWVQPLSNTLASEVQTELEAVNPNWLSNPGFYGGDTTPVALRKRLGLFSDDEAHNEKLGEVRLGNADPFVKEFGKAYVELIRDCRSQENITVDQWRSAFSHATTKMGTEASASDRNKFHLNALFEFESDQPFWIRVRTPDSYNAKCTALGLTGRRLNSTDSDYSSKITIINSMIRGYLLPFMMEYFVRDGRELSKAGAIPGFTIVRAAACDIYAVTDLNGFSSSGIAQPLHGSYVFSGVYMYHRDDRDFNNFRYNAYSQSPDAMQSNSLHETGHVLYYLHQHKGGASGGDDARHDANDNCGMSYAQNSYGDLCGRGILMLQGYDIQASNFESA